MITPKLEELIFEGVAYYKTWTIFSGSAGIDIPKNNTAVFLGFDYHPFIDARQVAAAAAQRILWNNLMNKEIVFYDRRRRITFLARNYFETVNAVRPDTHRYECYQPFEDKINMHIVTLPDPTFWDNVLYDEAPVGSNTLNPPLGYGSAQTDSSFAALGSVDFTTTQDFTDRSFENNPVSADVSYDQVGVAVTEETILQEPLVNPTNGYFGQQFPFITAHFVVINKKYTGKFL